MAIRMMAVKLMCIGMGTLMMGFYLSMPSDEPMEQEKLNIAKVYRGVEPESRWVKVDGTFLWNYHLVLEDMGGRDEAYIVPVVPASWREGQEIKMFVRLSALGNPEDRIGYHGTIDGLIHKPGLPKDAKNLLSEYNVAKDAILIINGADPVSMQRFANTLMTIGVLALFGGSVPFVIPMFGGGSSSGEWTGKKAQPDEEALLKAQLREQECEQEVSQWLTSRGISYGDNAAPEETAQADANHQDELVEV